MRPKTQRALMVDWCDFWGYKNKKVIPPPKKNPHKKNTSKASDEKYYKYELFTKTSMSYIIYKTLVEEYQYSIYIIYITYIFIYFYTH